jgi:hypothetical protein
VPTIWRERGFRFFFSSLDRPEPPHVHIESGDGMAKVWLSPVSLAWSAGYDAREVRHLLAMVSKHRDMMEQAWHDYFGT